METGQPVNLSSTKYEVRTQRENCSAALFGVSIVSTEEIFFDLDILESLAPIVLLYLP